MKNHFEIIVNDEELCNKLEEINIVLKEKFSKLEDLINGNLCMTSYFTGLNNF